MSKLCQNYLRNQLKWFRLPFRVPFPLNYFCVSVLILKIVFIKIFNLSENEKSTINTLKKPNANPKTKKPNSKKPKPKNSSTATASVTASTATTVAASAAGRTSKFRWRLMTKYQLSNKY